MPEEASGTEAAAVAQYQGQQHLWCPSASAVVAEPHHADIMSLVAHQGGCHCKSYEER